MILFLDTETTGLVQFSLPHDHPAQPHLVQLGCILTELDGTIRSTIDLIVRPNGYAIPEQATETHGISTELAERCGVPLTIAAATFVHLRSLASVIVAHNLPFDERVMQTAIYRTGKTVTVNSPSTRACTMEMAENVVRMPATDRMRAAGRGHQFKKPNLGECYKHFFREELANAHSALADVTACMKIYFAMTRTAP